MWFPIFVLVTFHFFSDVSSFEKIGCQDCHPLVDGKVNIHFVPHSHNDAGWRQTFDHYYEGRGPDYITEEEPSVRLIISSMIEALKANPERRFVQVEISFFWKWWQEQSDQVKKDVRQLVNEGRLEIVNGGWVMNDEATTDYQSIVDQFTWGFRIVNDTLGECGRPKIGWQIDPFGHSQEHVALLKAMDFRGMFFTRLDFRDREERIKKQNMEIRWRVDAVSDIFTSIFPNTYMTEPYFCFDVLCGDYVRDDNVQMKVKMLSALLDKYKDYYRTNNILIPMGGDFHFQKAEQNFKSIDKLIEGFNNHSLYHVLYSTPSCYMKAVEEELAERRLMLESYSGDFFPYADKPSSYWTGYYTSRPTLKRFERLAHSILQSAKQLASFSRIHGQSYDSSLIPLKESLGLVQHHDAITGTEKQKVTDDYVRMLTEAIRIVEKPAGMIISNLLKRNPSENSKDLQLRACLLKNVSICDISGSEERFYLIAYNPLAKSLTHHIRLPVSGTNYRITGPQGELMQYDIFDTINTFEYVKEPVAPTTKELVFRADNIPGFGLQLYYIEKLNSDNKTNYHPFEKTTNEVYSFGSESETSFTIKSGRLTSVTYETETFNLKQAFLYYVGSSEYSNDNLTPSGAYVFEPEKKPPTEIKWKSTKFARGSLVDEVIQEFDQQVTQIIRVYKNADRPLIEFDWLVGDLQIIDNKSRELITRFTLEDFKSNSTFYTDSNGRRMMTRIRSKRSSFQANFEEEPVTSNYYPVTSMISIEDEAKKVRFSVFSDRAQGGSSLTDGSIELMIHRRLAVDDGKGVNEVLSEMEYDRGVFVRGSHHISFLPIDATKEVILASELLQETWILLGANKNISGSLDAMKQAFNFEFKGLNKQLPENTNILTFEPWKNNYLLRFEQISRKTEEITNLEGLFSTFNITNIEETYLGANLKKEKSRKVSDKLTLKPFEIRTFLINTDRNNNEDDNNNSTETPTDKNNSAVKIESLLTFVFVLLFSLPEAVFQ